MPVRYQTRSSVKVGRQPLFVSRVGKDPSPAAAQPDAQMDEPYSLNNVANSIASTNLMSITLKLRVVS